MDEYEPVDTPMESKDFTSAEHAAVDEMAAPLIRQAIADKKFKGKKNRKAWMRMNRPHKTEAIDRGAEKIHVFLDRVNPPIPEEDPEFLEIPKFLRNQENLKEEEELEEAHRLLDTVEDRPL